MKRTDYFRMVRDIYYHIPINSEEVDHTCLGKHILLKRCLEGIGMKVRPRICEFSWSDMPLPSELIIIPHEDAYHVYLEGQIHGEWHTIDATWDKSLDGILQVNNWNGKSSTSIAVPQRKIYSSKESLEIFHEEENIEEDLRINGDFYKSFNSWLDDARLKLRAKPESATSF